MTKNPPLKMLIETGTVITASAVRYDERNTSTLQNCITMNLRDSCPKLSLEGLVEHIVVRTVDFIEDPFRAGLKLPCLDIYSTVIAELVSSTWYLLKALLI